jgi:hypothetical protein
MRVLKSWRKSMQHRSGKGPEVNRAWTGYVERIKSADAKSRERRRAVLPRLKSINGKKVRSS